MPTVEDTIQQNVNPNKDYAISVIIGQGQKGRTAFRKPNGQKINEEEVYNEPLGTGEQLIAKGELFISSMATDVQPHTNRTSLLIQLNGNQIGYYEEDAAGDNGTVFYDIKILFQS